MVHGPRILQSFTQVIVTQLRSRVLNLAIVVAQTPVLIVPSMSILMQGLDEGVTRNTGSRRGD